jgi:chromate transporter
MTIPFVGPLMTGAHGVANSGTVAALLDFFAKAGAFVFGSGLAIVAFLYGGVVRDFHSLSERQFLDAVAVAMITPGRVVITAAFVGYLVRRSCGRLRRSAGRVRASVLYRDCRCTLLSPFCAKCAGQRIRARGDCGRLGRDSRCCCVLGRWAIVDWQTWAIATATFISLLVTRKIPEPLLIIAAGLLGLALQRGTH